MLNVGTIDTVLPYVIFDDPEPYANMPLIYSNENAAAGLGTQARVDIQVGNGSSIVSYNFKNNGYAYNSGDILTIPTEVYPEYQQLPTLPNSESFKLQ